MINLFSRFYPQKPLGREPAALCRGVLLGAAVGDALGVPFEFLSREEVRSCFVPEMVGIDTEYRVFSRWGELIPAGTWSDDTAMALASLQAIVDCGGAVVPEIQMEYFEAWWNTGRFACGGRPFGLGGCIARALQRHARGTGAVHCGGDGERDNGNGALMRIWPVSLSAICQSLSPLETRRLVLRGCCTTHRHEISNLGCFLFTELLRGLAEGLDARQSLDRVRSMDLSGLFSAEVRRKYDMLLLQDPAEWSEDAIRESGFVADTLHGAVWSLLQTDSYEAAICEAVRLGYDTDTTACVTGALAGALYGAKAIPRRWLLAMRDREVLEQAAQTYGAWLDGLSGQAAAFRGPEKEEPLPGERRQFFGLDTGVDLVLCFDDSPVIGPEGTLCSIPELLTKHFSALSPLVFRLSLQRRLDFQQLRVRAIRLSPDGKPLQATGFFFLPDQKVPFLRSLGEISPIEQGEDLRAALQEALCSDWNRHGYNVRRQIITFYTRQVLPPFAAPLTREDPAAAQDPIVECWEEKLHPTIKRLILFVPDEGGWYQISSNWDNVVHFPTKPAQPYSWTDVVTAIMKSL